MNDSMQRPTGLARAVAILICGIATTAAAHESGGMFAMMDTNKDGAVSAAEHAAAVNKMFGEMDANGDGKVTAAEMDAHHPMMKKEPAATGTKTMNDAAMDHGAMHGAMSSAEKIASMDTDGDGVLTKSEYTTGAQAKFSEMDTDGNGSLSRQEMAAGHAAMKSAKPARTP